ncbi:uncharacterized protein LOC124350170 [Daphnia pulicaria]|uniref:uncharacterized protein LOC124350170 n=1 Tax=Daphnia pulicaria TaxID=35523 RepID=UPI001EEA318F|nr:uncharacterized protein LOC124350170 [Daphnia pulicaria]XP_046657169.1 uncharacterized protein LOC124350170 [Daphnia pulicaria]
MDKTDSVFEFNQNEHEPSASSDEGKARRWVTLPMEPATPKEWESWRMKKSLVESEMLQKLAQHHEKFHDEMKMQLICLQEKCQQSFRNFQQELDAAFIGELLKLQNENEMLKKELEK